MKKPIILWAALSILPFFSGQGLEKVKDFSFNDIEGKSHNFSDYQGKWVLVNYWATYCPPCHAEIPDIERFAQDNKDDFIVLGMDAGGSQINEILSFKEQLNISYDLIPMQQSTMLSFGTIVGIPTSYIVNPKGEIVDKYVGIITYDDLDFHINPPIYKSASANKNPIEESFDSITPNQ
ncbi:TlpA disulfide reductase family protein [uncultured Cocleimonas sp.]|uniref:TlpA disulfide reductase family protein n=1 Tax=uncultured Cocleimonas sp. TaxID=1051587 RepID=UPI002621C4E2|nr:TlpA disulfide reductase family protein [uncultured Cocleimonas sp.]